MIVGIDHFVITVMSLDAAFGFYEDVFKFMRFDARGQPTALMLGQQKINVHEMRHTFEPKAAAPASGAADFCLIAETPLDLILKHLESCGVLIEVGPVERNGAQGKMDSV